MRDTPPCALCSKDIAPGTRAVYVTVEGESAEQVYHMDCFALSTTGSFRKRAIWTYRVVNTPAEGAL